MRNSFVFYRGWKEALDELSNGEKLAIYEAICNYALDGKIPDFTGLLNALFKSFVPQIDINTKRWDNGRKGGAPKGNKNAEKQNVTKDGNNQKQPKNNQKQPNVQCTMQNVQCTMQNVNECKSAAKACTHALTGGETYEKYVAWLRDNAPYIFSHYTNLITEAQLSKLQETYPLSTILQTIAQVENRSDWRKKYVNLYMTVKNWIRKEASNGK